MLKPMHTATKDRREGREERRRGGEEDRRTGAEEERRRRGEEERRRGGVEERGAAIQSGFKRLHVCVAGICTGFE